MNKRSELKRRSGLLAGNHSMIMVYETTSTSSDRESTWDGEIKAGMMMILEQRIIPSFLTMITKRSLK